MAQDYESVVTLRRVDLQKKVSDGILFTFMAGVGLIVTYKKNVYYQVTNIWFAYASNQCKNYPPEIDYYSVPEIGDVFNK